MTLLAQARIEASDTASVPPLVMVKREQVIDILGLLEPFEEALQVTEQVNKNLMCAIITPGIFNICNEISKSTCVTLCSVIP